MQTNCIFKHQPVNIPDFVFCVELCLDQTCLSQFFFTSKCRSSILSAQPKFGQRTVSDRISLLAKLSGNSWSSDNISLSTGHLCPVSLICKKKNRNCWSFLSTSLLKQVPVNFWIIRKPFISKSLLHNLPDYCDANKELTRIQNWPVKLVMINEIET